MVDNLYFWNCLKNVIVCNEVTDALAEVTDLDADIPLGDAACPFPMIMIVSGYTLSR